MRSARNEAGLSLVDATFELRSYLPKPLWCSIETIRRLESPKADENKADTLLIIALANVYGVGVARLLSPVAANELDIPLNSRSM